MTDDRLHVREWHNGDKDCSPYSDAGMQRRPDDLRRRMTETTVDAALFTSYHCITCLSG
jgi:creatinase